MKMLKKLYQTDWYTGTPVHIMDLVVSQWITVCMRVVHTKESIVTDFIAIAFVLNSCIMIRL